jgi:4-hydroxybenzoate polyprenyltransferase
MAALLVVGTGLRRQRRLPPEAGRGKQMSGLSARVADATGNWVDTRAPQWSRPYLRLSRLDRPIGSWLLLLPCWWSAALAAGFTGDIRSLPLVLALFFIGAFAMRGAGCTWNDITDRDLDALVERTRSRPLPAGQVSVSRAATFLVIQALLGLAVLLQFNRFAVATGIASLVIVAVYPFMKRITWWPQIVLGLAFSWGALMGFAVQLGRLDATALLLYAGSIAWVIGYDTIYAHQDAEDDALIGVKSTALLFGARTHAALMAFYASAVVLIGTALVLAGAGWAAWGGLAAFAVHLGWQIWRLKISDPALCLRIFKSNRDAGLLLLIGLLGDAAMRAT